MPNQRLALTKARIADAVAGAIDVHVKEAYAIVEVVLSSIVGSLNRGDEVKLHGFGSFRLHQKEARTRSNPKTGARVDLPAKKVLRFKPGKELLKIINP